MPDTLYKMTNESGQWERIPLTDDEVADLNAAAAAADLDFSDVRVRRNVYLAESDWTQLANAPLTSAKQTAWATHRQALRDLPASSSTVSGIVWPEAP